MQFADPRATATAYLILRHLYDGDIIEWPIPDDHPLREIFMQLEAQGYVARWDRVWPLHDRYRLTEKGISSIEAVYRPAGADAFFAKTSDWASFVEFVRNILAMTYSPEDLP